jgi:NADH-quinone oxidoreductase subunit H
MLFLVSMFAECNRNPFDVAEGESEIVAGFHTEFASSKFMLFMTAEYLHVLIASALIATLYLGGYSLLPFPLPVGGKEGLEWMTLDTAWVQGHLNLIGGAMLSLGGLTLVGLSWLVGRHKRAYARLGASDAADRLREFGFFAGLFMILGLFSLAGGAACLLLEPPAPVAGLYYQAKPVYPLWVNLVTAVVQLHVVLGKTLAVAWLFIWVRWTLPRFRYDQIMALGWKVMLNIALVNLLVTALIAKLVR